MYRKLLPGIAVALLCAGPAVAQEVTEGPRGSEQVVQTVECDYRQWVEYDGYVYDIRPGQPCRRDGKAPVPGAKPAPAQPPRPAQAPAKPAKAPLNLTRYEPPAGRDPRQPGLLHFDTPPRHENPPDGYATVCPKDSGMACDHELVQDAVGAGRIAIWGGNDPAAPLEYRGWACWSSSPCDIVGFGKVRPLVVSVTERPLGPDEPERTANDKPVKGDNPHTREAVISVHGDMHVRDVNFLGKPVTPNVGGVFKALAPRRTIVIERVGFRKAHMCVYPVGGGSTVTLRQVWCEGAGANNRVHGIYAGSKSPPHEVTVEFSYFGPQPDDGNHIRYPHAGHLILRYNWFGGPGDEASSALNIGCGTELDAVGNVFWNGRGHMAMIKLDGASGGCKGAAKLRMAYNTFVNTRENGRIVRAYFAPDVVASEIVTANNLMVDAGPAGLTPARAWVDWAAEPKASYELAGFRLRDGADFDERLRLRVDVPAEPVAAEYTPSHNPDGSVRDGSQMGAWGRE